jgi:hypothetical protein
LQELRDSVGSYWASIASEMLTVHPEDSATDEVLEKYLA